jgi:CMP-N,N'-diacetyllegionaminic acid synthase
MSKLDDLPFVVALIPARGGSTRIPQKNLAPLGGHPLLAHTVLAARKANLVSNVYVSTDCSAIASASRRYGASVVRRPAELATAEAPTEPSLFHAVETIERNEARRVDVIVMLQVTSPLRRAHRIDQAIELMMRTACDSVVSVTPEVGYYFLGDIGPGGKLEVGYDPHNRLRTQDIPPRYRENGAIYVMTREQLMERRCRMGGDMRALVMNAEEAIDIDDAVDLKLCTVLLAEQRGLTRAAAPLRLDEPHTLN